MAQVKVSSKYRIVVPREVRNAVGIHRGQTVSVAAIGGVIEIVPDRDAGEDSDRPSGDLGALGLQHEAR